MKKSLLALAVLGTFVGAASAQSSVTVYGRLDTGLVYEGGSIVGNTSTLKVTSGVNSASKLGFTGVEDLGSGMKARFRLETAVCSDSAGGNNTSPMFCGGGDGFMGREATVALDGAFGSVVLGRQVHPMFINQANIDPFGTGLAGQVDNLLDPVGLRMNNSVSYVTPAMGGFNAWLAYGAGENQGNKSGDRRIAFLGSYTAGPLYVGLGYDRLNGGVANGGTSNDSLKNTNFGGTYDFGPAKGHFLYQVEKQEVAGATTMDKQGYMLGVSAPLGQGSVMASYINQNDKRASNQDATQFGLGYVYHLSKRTEIYTAYAKISNKNGATYTVGNGNEAGSGNKAFNFGIGHNF